MGLLIYFEILFRGVGCHPIADMWLTLGGGGLRFLPSNLTLFGGVLILLFITKMFIYLVNFIMLVLGTPLTDFFL